jgi:hypothetical protein
MPLLCGAGTWCAASVTVGPREEMPGGFFSDGGPTAGDAGGPDPWLRVDQVQRRVFHPSLEGCGVCHPQFFILPSKGAVCANVPSVSHPSPEGCGKRQCAISFSSFPRRVRYVPMCHQFFILPPKGAVSANVPSVSHPSPEGCGKRQCAISFSSFPRRVRCAIPPSAFL